MDTKPQEFEPGRLRWRCRRGMRELDAALLAYLDNHYTEADDAEKQTFHELLAVPDPELMQYVVRSSASQQSDSAAQFEPILKKIRATLTA